VIGGWRKLHNVELPNLCSLPSIITSYHVEDEMVGVCSTHGGEKECAWGFGLVGK
jgi:hypothetical protein